MRARSRGIDGLRRRRISWCVALVAALLNALAPVFAYAIGQPLHELAGGRSGGGAQMALAAQAARHAGQHGGTLPHPAARDAGMHGMHQAAALAPAADADGAHSHEPAAPHCAYCLDFAAGAALATTLPMVPGAELAHAPPPQTPPAHVSARDSLRLAAPRGPPFAG